MTRHCQSPRSGDGACRPVGLQYISDNISGYHEGVVLGRDVPQLVSQSVFPVDGLSVSSLARHSIFSGFKDMNVCCYTTPTFYIYIFWSFFFAIRGFKGTAVEYQGVQHYRMFRFTSSLVKCSFMCSLGIEEIHGL